MKQQIQIDQTLAEQYILELGHIGAYGETGVWRTVYSPEWAAAQDRVAAWMSDAGLDVRRDAVGNVWGSLGSPDLGNTIVTGSHIDSQTPGGRYDGALGVIAGILSLRALKEQFGTPARAVEAVSLCEEEGSRFQEAGFWGSRAIIGRIGADEPGVLRGYGGETMAEAMREVGLDPARIGEAAREDIRVFIELHIEQGPILEEAGVPVAIVDAITGQRRYVVQLEGRSDHAGARPMDTRRDAMHGAAEVIVAGLKTAIDMGRPAVTTIGRVFVEPNLPSAVPEKVTFTIDARHPDPRVLDNLYARHEDIITSIAKHRDLGFSWQVVMDIRPTLADLDIVGVLEEAALEQSVRSLRMQSGAGHDTQNMARIAQTAMIFVRSKGGRSHTPAEFTSVPDAVAGIRVLGAALHELAY